MIKHISRFAIFPERLGYFPSSPGLSCKQILDSEDSGGDGEYWIDPENNGNPLQVYCDMTTDGGDYEQLLDEVFVISRIIKVEVKVISRSRRPRLITLT